MQKERQTELSLNTLNEKMSYANDRSRSLLDQKAMKAKEINQTIPKVRR